MQNQIKRRKYFSIHQHESFRNFNIKHLQWDKADLPKEKKRFQGKIIYEFQSQQSGGVQ